MLGSHRNASDNLAVSKPARTRVKGVRKMRSIRGLGDNLLPVLLAVMGLAVGLMPVHPAAASSKNGYWAVAYRLKGAGWAAASAGTQHEAIRLAKAQCDKTDPKPGGRHYTDCILSQAFSTDDNACVHIFEAFNSGFAVFVGSSLGARTGNAAAEAAEEAHNRCLNRPGFTSSICGVFVRPNQAATYCSKQFR